MALGRRVLISPMCVGHAGWMGRQLPVALTRRQVERSPDIDTRKPESRQQEAEYARYYGYPFYWGAAGLWGMGAYPGDLTAQGRIEEDVKGHGTRDSSSSDDCHLCSSNAVIGYHIRATDGEIGRLEDLLVDDYTWAIRYLVMNTSNWWGDSRVLVAPGWIDNVSWSDSKVAVALTRQVMENAPRYESTDQLNANWNSSSMSTATGLGCGPSRDRRTRTDHRDVSVARRRSRS